MILGIPQFAPCASVAFTLVGRLLQRFQQPLKLSFRMTYPGGGQYECLSLFSEDRTQLCDLNLRSGRIHVFQNKSPAGLSKIESWPEPDNYLLASISSEHGLERVLDDITAALGLHDPDFSLYSGCLALTLGMLFARFLFESETLSLENGWVQDNHWPDWLESVPEDCMLTKPYNDDIAGMLWRVRHREQTVLFDDEIAYLIGTSETLDLCSEIRTNDGSPHTAANPN